MTLPLLIGGATTSRQHTAVKIAPVFSQPVVHVLDASRVVNVMSDLLDTDRKVELDARNREDQERLREEHAHRMNRPLLPYDKALANRQAIEWRQEDLPAPSFLGTAEVEVPVGRAAPLHRLDVLLHGVGDEGPLPADPGRPAAGRGGPRPVRRGQRAARRHRGARAAGRAGRVRLLARAGRGRRRGRRDRSRARCGSRCSASRRRSTMGGANRSLADFVAPADAGLHDHIGAFAVTAGIGAEELAHEFEAGQRRLPGDHGEGAGRPAGGGVRGAPAPRGAASVGLRGRGPDARGADGRALPGHPAGVRVPGVPRPPGEGAAVRPAGRARRGHRPDRDVRDDAARVGQRSVPGAPAGAVLRGRAHRARPGGGLRETPGRARRRRRSGGSGRTSATSRSTTPLCSAVVYRRAAAG